MREIKQQLIWDTIPSQLKGYYEEAMIRLIELDELDLRDLNEEQQTEAICLAAVEKNGWMLKYVYHQTPAICEAAIWENSKVIPYATYISETLWYELIKEDCLNVDVFPSQLQREDVYRHSIELDPSMISMIPNPSEELCLMAVQTNPELIDCITNPSERVQLAAVRQDGGVIRFINHPSEVVQEAAIEQWSGAIEFINHPSESLQLKAISKNPLNVRLIKKPSDYVQWVAVRQENILLEGIVSPSARLKTEGLKGYPNFFNHLDHLLYRYQKWNLSTEDWLTVAMNMPERIQMPQLLEEISFPEELGFILKDTDDWQAFLKSNASPFLSTVFQSLKQVSKIYRLDQNRTTFQKQTSKKTNLTIEQALEEVPVALGLLPNAERSYRRCRLAMTRSHLAKGHSPYHYWELKEEGIL